LLNAANLKSALLEKTVLTWIDFHIIFQGA
jgi:hypothetical protein